jgi:hypothetical protein
VKVISSVAKATYEFFDYHPDATLEIHAVDDKRLRFYNTIFKRRYQEIRDTFVIKGLFGDLYEDYKPERFYDGFELFLKNR